MHQQRAENQHASTSDASTEGQMRRGRRRQGPRWRQRRAAGKGLRDPSTRGGRGPKKQLLRERENRERESERERERTRSDWGRARRARMARATAGRQGTRARSDGQKSITRSITRSNMRSITRASRNHVAAPKTLLSCCVTRMNVVLLERCFSATAPTYVHADLPLEGPLQTCRRPLRPALLLQICRPS